MCFVAEYMNEGHRERVRETYDEAKLQGAQDYKVLEMLLFYVIPRKDTKPAAKKLIKELGTLENVLKAPQERLARIDGIGENAARYLNLLGNTFEHISMPKIPKKLTEETTESVLKHLFRDAVREEVYIICLDPQNNILGYEKLSEGSFESADFDPAKAARIALRYDSSQVVFAHNHPSGICEASGADIKVTELLEGALYMMGIKLLDHIIFAGDKYISIVKNYKLHKDRSFGKWGRRQ